MEEDIVTAPSVTIPLDEYNSLIRRDDLLSCLEACGVDNWQGFYDAMEMFRDSDKEGEMEYGGVSYNIHETAKVSSQDVIKVYISYCKVVNYEYEESKQQQKEYEDNRKKEIALEKQEEEKENKSQIIEREGFWSRLFGTR